MNIALLLNDRLDREELSARMTQPGIEVDSYATAAQALGVLCSRPFDVFVMDAKTYPGLGCADAVIAELAALLPDSQHIENLLYWQVGLRLLELMRADTSPNGDALVMIRFPELPDFSFNVGDALTRDGVESDLRNKGNVEAAYGISMDAFIERVVKRVSGLANGGAA